MLARNTCYYEHSGFSRDSSLRFGMTNSELSELTLASMLLDSRHAGTQFFHNFLRGAPGEIFLVWFE